MRPLFLLAVPAFYAALAVLPRTLGVVLLAVACVAWWWGALRLLPAVRNPAPDAE